MKDKKDKCGFLVNTNKTHILFRDMQNVSWMLPINTLVMKFVPINENEGRYDHFIYHGENRIEIDGVLFFEIQDWIYKSY